MIDIDNFKEISIVIVKDTKNSSTISSKISLLEQYVGIIGSFRSFDMT